MFVKQIQKSLIVAQHFLSLRIETVLNFVHPMHLAELPELQMQLMDQVIPPSGGNLFRLFSVEQFNRLLHDEHLAGAIERCSCSLLDLRAILIDWITVLRLSVN